MVTKLRVWNNAIANVLGVAVFSVQKPKYNLVAYEEHGNMQGMISLKVKANVVAELLFAQMVALSFRRKINSETVYLEKVGVISILHEFTDRVSQIIVLKKSIIWGAWKPAR